MSSVFSATVQELPWLIRAGFTDQRGWEEVSGSVGVRTFGPAADDATFLVIDDQEFDGLTPERLLTLEPYQYGTFLLVDHLTLTHPERPLLAVDVNREPGRSFRLIPSEVAGFADNMLIANMDFADFADNVDTDGIFRGFPSGPPPGPAAAGVPGDIPEPDSSPGSLDDLRREADPDNPTSFIGQFIREGFWNPASWQRLEAGMREACRRYNGAEEIPRDLAAAFHSVMVRTPNLLALSGTILMDPGAMETRLERIRVLSAWFFRGWTTEQIAGPLRGDYNPDAFHG